MSSQVRELQKNIETIKYDIASKRKAAALDGVKKAKTILTNSQQANSMIQSCRDAKLCTTLLADMKEELEPLSLALSESQDVNRGSEQEGKALETAVTSQLTLTKLLTTLQEQMIPKGYVTPVPAIYNDLPQLKQRATVEMVIQKGQPGVPFDVKGVNFKEAKLVMIIDGYTGMLFCLSVCYYLLLVLSIWICLCSQTCVVMVAGSFLFHQYVFDFVFVFVSKPCSSRHGWKLCRLGRQGLLYQYENSTFRWLCRPDRRPGRGRLWLCRG